MNQNITSFIIITIIFILIKVNNVYSTYNQFEASINQQQSIQKSIINKINNIIFNNFNSNSYKNNNSNNNNNHDINSYIIKNSNQHNNNNNNNIINDQLNNNSLEDNNNSLNYIQIFSKLNDPSIIISFIGIIFLSILLYFKLKKERDSYDDIKFDSDNGYGYTFKRSGSSSSINSNSTSSLSSLFHQLHINGSKDCNGSGFINKVINPYVQKFKDLLLPKVNKCGIKYYQNGELGRGSYGKVVKANYLNQRVAIKTAFDMDDFSWNEAICHQSLNGHKNIVDLIGIYDYDRSNVGPSYICEIMDGNLVNFINNNIQELYNKPRSIIKIINEISDGLKHMHSQGFVHVDLHMGNILYKGIEKKNGMIYPSQIKICDFGLCKSLSNDHLQHHNYSTGCTVYMSPEVKVGGRSQYSVADDIYSLGVLMWYMYGIIYIPKFRAAQELLLNCGQFRFDNIPVPIRNIIIKCLYPKSIRPSINEIEILIKKADKQLYSSK